MAVPALPEGHRKVTKLAYAWEVLRRLPALMVESGLRYGATPKDVVLLALVSAAMWEAGSNNLPKIAWWMGFDVESGRKHLTPKALTAMFPDTGVNLSRREAIHEHRVRALKTHCQCEGCEAWRREMWEGHEQSNAHCGCQGCITVRIIEIDRKMRDGAGQSVADLNALHDHVMARLAKAKHLGLIERAVMRENTHSSKKV